MSNRYTGEYIGVIKSSFVFGRLVMCSPSDMLSVLTQLSYFIVLIHFRFHIRFLRVFISIMSLQVGIQEQKFLRSSKTLPLHACFGLLLSTFMSSPSDRFVFFSSRCDFLSCEPLVGESIDQLLQQQPLEKCCLHLGRDIFYDDCDAVRVLSCLD